MTSVKRKDYLMGKILILEDLIKEYQNLISEREASVRLIKRNKRRKERELQKKKKLLEIKKSKKEKKIQKKELTTEIFFDIIYSVDWEKVGGRTMEREEEKQSDR